MTGHKEWCGFMAQAVTQLGAILVASSYRLAPEHRFPVFLEDSLDAMAAISAMIGRFGGAGDRLFVSGHSAGGHIAALVALRQDLWRGRLPKGHLRGALPISAALDLRDPSPAPGSLEEAVYTTVLARAEDDEAASPLALVGHADLPFVLTWGSKDTPRVMRSNLAMEEKLKAQGRLFAALKLEGAGHFDTHLNLQEPDHPWYAAFRALLVSTK